MEQLLLPENLNIEIILKEFPLYIANACNKVKRIVSLIIRLSEKNKKNTGNPKVDNSYVNLKAQYLNNKVGRGYKQIIEWMKLHEIIESDNFCIP